MHKIVAKKKITENGSHKGNNTSHQDQVTIQQAFKIIVVTHAK